MRQVGTLANETHAQRFIDYLVTLDIEARADEDLEGWIIWVMDEEQIARAASELKDFRANPDDARYADVSGPAERRRREKMERQQAAAKNVVEMRGSWNRGMSRRAPVTFALIAICVVVFMLTHMASPELSSTTFRLLAFRDPIITQASLETPTADSFRDIKRGQLWRLATPMFLHADHWHLFFNMYMLYYFGGQVESRRSWVMLLVFVVFAAVFSTVAQVILTGPNVVGISGVVYALFGYIWMKARFDPRSGFFIGQFTVMILIGWFFAGFLDFGMFSNIANGAHGAGLLVGVVLGYLPELVPALRKIL